jgi:hypothetical protein
LIIKIKNTQNRVLPILLFLGYFTPTNLKEMKKLILLLTLCMPMLVATAQSAKKTTKESTQKAAIAFNELIVDEQKKIGKLITELFENIDAHSKQELLDKSQVLYKQCQSSEKLIKAQPIKNGNGPLKEAALTLFAFYGKITKEEYTELVELLKKDELLNEDLERMKAINSDVTEREKILDEAFINEQKNFAELHGFILE